MKDEKLPQWWIDVNKKISKVQAKQIKREVDRTKKPAKPVDRSSNE